MACEEAKQDEDGSHEEGNLQSGTHGDVERQIDLVFHGDDYGGDVFGGAANKGYKDHTYE